MTLGKFANFKNQSKSFSLVYQPMHIYIYIYIYIYCVLAGLSYETLSYQAPLSMCPHSLWYILYLNGGINVIFELSWLENLADTYMRHTEQLFRPHQQCIP